MTPRSGSCPYRFGCFPVVMVPAALAAFLFGPFRVSRAEGDDVRQKIRDIGQRFVDTELADDKMKEISDKVAGAVQEVLESDDQKAKYQKFVLEPITAAEGNAEAWGKRPLSERIQLKVADPMVKAFTEVELTDDQLQRLGEKMQEVLEQYLAEAAGKAPDEKEPEKAESKNHIPTLTMPVEDDPMPTGNYGGGGGGKGGQVFQMNQAKPAGGTVAGKKKAAPKKKVKGGGGGGAAGP